ncbi:MAG: transposase, partial [Clostridiales bacterium]|nr:transposase [Clostridiales bacterium]
MVEALTYDIRLQVAMHTTSYWDQPLTDKTLSRFRKRCYEHEMETGEDLLKECILKISAQIALEMNISGQLKRMDSMMISSNIKKLSRMELIYTCISNLAK